MSLWPLQSSRARVTLPANPYAAYLLSTLAGSDGFDTSRRLVSAAAQPGVVRRHLLLALSELPDTRSGLLKTFLWNEDIIHHTLEEIANVTFEMAEKGQNEIYVGDKKLKATAIAIHARALSASDLPQILPDEE